MTALPSWQASLRDRLDAMRRSGRLRAARSEASQGARVRLDTNDYLQLRRHPALAQAMCHAATAEGVGAGASRLAGGSHPLHEQAEQRLAQLVRAEAATLFPAGYMANLAALTALTQPGDLLLLDRLCHASLIDAAAVATSRLRGQGRAVRFFCHNDVEHAAEQARRWQRRSDHSGGVWIVVESVHSMEGDAAPLLEFARLRDQLVGEGRSAALLVDEAHAVGVVGPGGAGLCAET
ncbi:MAG: aminotransferase class I/II-fold pyridoxal phosphate-dependent enzyme, partial [Planctomycetota bacterium]